MEQKDQIKTEVFVFIHIKLNLFILFQKKNYQSLHDRQKVLFGHYKIEITSLLLIFSYFYELVLFW